MTQAKAPSNEARKGPTVTRQGTVMELIRTADELRRYFTDFYEPHDITPQQYNVLRILRGVHPESLPTMEIAEKMVEKTPGITRLLDRLEEKGLIARERPAEDRRRVLISISSEGIALLSVLEDPVRKATKAVLQGLSGEEVEQLYSMLRHVRNEI